MNPHAQTKLRDTLAYCAISLSLASAASAQTAAEQTDLYATLSGSVEASSNAFLNSEEEDDTIFRVTPKVGFSRENGLFELEGSASLTEIKFDDFSENDTTNVSTKLSGAYNSNPLAATASVDYTQDTTASGVVGTVLETNTLTLDGDADYHVSSAMGISAGVTYTATDPEDLTAGLGETTVWSVRGGGFYEYSSALRLNLDIRYRETEVSDYVAPFGGLNPAADVANDSEDIALIFSARGQLTAAIEGLAEIGIQQRSYDVAGSDDDTSPYFGIAAIWTINSMTTFDVAGSYDYSTSLSNLSSESIQLNGTLTHQFTSQLGGNIGAGIEESSFEAPGLADRDDSAYTLFGGLSYDFTDWGTVGIQLNYGDRDSDLDSATYDVFTTTLSASVFF